MDDQSPGGGIRILPFDDCEAIVCKFYLKAVGYKHGLMIALVRMLLQTFFQYDEIWILQIPCLSLQEEWIQGPWQLAIRQVYL